MLLMEAKSNSIQAFVDIAMTLRSKQDTSKSASKWQQPAPDCKPPPNIYYRYDRHQYQIRFQGADGEIRHKTVSTVPILDSKCSPEERLDKRKSAFQSAVDAWNLLDESKRPRMSAVWGGGGMP